MGRIKRNPPKSESGLIRDPDSLSAKGSVLNLHPKFSLSYIRHNDKYCLSQCTRDEKAAFAGQLHLLSQMTWGEIRKSPRHNLGFEFLTPSAIHAPIPPKFKGEKVAVFRFDGKKPMAGFLEHDTFHIVWLDRDFTLYKHS